MFDVACESAEMAARLARAVGPRGVVCLGCPLTGDGRAPAEQVLITVSRPPLDLLRIDLERLLLLVAFTADPFYPQACAAAVVPEVWLFEVQERLLTALSTPLEGRYRRRSLILPGERRRLAALPAVELTPLPAG